MRVHGSAVYVTGALAVLALFVALFSTELNRWNNVTPSLVIPSNAWHLVFEAASDSACPATEAVGPVCAASPKNPTLWKSPLLRRSPQVSTQRVKLQGKDYWMGVQVSAEQLRQARALTANHLVLGWIFGQYRVWINGQYVTEGSSRRLDPMILDLPISYLSGDEPLSIAIHVHPAADSWNGDYLANPEKEGLATQAQASAFHDLTAFARRSRPFAFFLLNFTYSIAFFFLWRSRKMNADYFYIAAFGLTEALVQLRVMDLFRDRLSYTYLQAFDIFLAMAEGSFALLLSFAFARCRRELFKWTAILGLVAPWGVALVWLGLIRNGVRLHPILYSWFVPAACFMGAAVALIQSVGAKGAAPRGRVQRLILFAAGMVIIGVLYRAQWAPGVTLEWNALFSRFAQYFIVLFISAIALVDYRAERKLIEKTPVSRYHRRRDLPEKIGGAILVVDLKNSEALIRFSSEIGQTGKLLEACLSQLWSAVMDEKGTVLQSEGDQLHAFFDHLDCEDPAQSALRATETFKRRLDDLTLRFHDQYGLPESMSPLQFRAAIALGEIKPVWKEVQNTRLAGWTETGCSHPFLESARFLELEKKIAVNVSGSLVVMSSSLSEELSLRAPSLESRWMFKDHRLVGKHDRIYRMAAYIPGAEPVMEKAAA